MWEKTLNDLLNQKDRVVLVIDGPCASGKTTLAESLAKDLDGVVIHCDDFFLRPEQRTSERYAEPGGNLDRERFYEEVVLPLGNGSFSSYRPFDCSEMKLSDPIVFPPKRLYIVEGSYSMHPAFGRYYDLSLFLSVSQEEQLLRLVKRCPEKLSTFQSRWIPLERAYFEAFQIEKNCDYII